MTARILCAAAILIAAVTPLHAALGRVQSCSEREIARAADALDVARNVLLAFPIGDGTETKVSPEVQRAIAAMKARLGDFIAAYMRCAPIERDAAAIEADLFRLGPAGDEVPPYSGRYGAQLKFAVKQWRDHPRIIGIVPSFAIECGSDAMLFVFRDDGAAWREALRWHSPPYGQVSGAWWSFDYAISPVDEQDRWFVVAKSIAPWCSSTWSEIRYAALRPAHAGSAPGILYQAKDPIWWGGDDLGTISADRDTLEVRFHAGSIDLDVPDRLWIRRFMVEGDRVRRVDPVTSSPQDFADEWIVRPWSEMVHWSASPSLSRWHDRLRRMRHFAYDSIRRCGERSDRVQVGLRSEKDDAPCFLRVEGQSHYVMTAVSPSADPACDGVNLLETRGLAPDKNP